MTPCAQVANILTACHEHILTACHEALSRKLRSLFRINEATHKRPCRVSKQSIDSPEIFKTMTLYKLARPLSGMKFCSRDRIHF